MTAPAHISRANGRKGGRPVGSLSEATKENLKAQDALRIKILKSTDKLYQSQMALASGCSFLYCVTTSKKGIKSKPELITSQAVIEKFLQGTLNEKDSQEFHFITTEKPDTRAIDSMMDRVFGKAPQSLDVTSDGEKLGPLETVFSAVSNKTGDIPSKDKKS